MMGPRGSIQATGMRIVKRYPNRKLYDATARRYVTLDDIARLVRRGEDVRVLDRATNQDVTTVTLSQVLHARERRRKIPLPRSAFTGLLRRGSSHADARGNGALRRALARLEARVDALEKAAGPNTSPSGPGRGR